jgi:hypothetical protein
VLVICRALSLLPSLFPAARSRCTHTSGTTRCWGGAGARASMSPPTHRWAAPTAPACCTAPPRPRLCGTRWYSRWRSAWGGRRRRCWFAGLSSAGQACCPRACTRSASRRVPAATCWAPAASTGRSGGAKCCAAAL